MAKTHTCKNCGKALKQEFKVCPYCGTPVDTLCRSCGKALKSGFNHCPYCGTSVAGAETSKQKTKKDHTPGKSGQFFRSFGGLVVNFAALIWTWIKLLPARVVRTVRSIDWYKLKNILSTIVRSIADFFKNLFTAIRGWDWQGLGEKLRHGMGGLGDVALKAFTWIKRQLSAALVFARNTFRTLREYIAVKFLNKMPPASARRLSAGILIGLLVTLCAFPLLLLSGDDGSHTPKHTQQTAGESAAAEPLSTIDPDQQTWLLMFYLDADDNVLEEDLLFDLNEIESVGSSERVQLVAQVDRFPESFSGDGDWTGARRYALTTDTDLNTTASEVVSDLGEVDMGDTDSLVDFVSWAIESYPADRHVLIMSDHGAGWIGGWFDDDPTHGGMIQLDQLDAALARIRERTGIGKFDLIGMDACNMGMLEVYSMLSQHARYAVASEEYEPGVGWAYNHFISDLVQKPQMSAADLGSSIVEGYIDQDLRILDDDARQAMLAGVDVKTEYSAEIIAEKIGEDITLSAVDLARIPALHEAFNELLVAVKDMDQSLLAEARSFAQPFSNVFHDQLPSPLIDLGSFIDLLAEMGADSPIPAHVDQIKAVLGDAIIAERHGSKVPGSSGISLYFPVSEHYFLPGIYSQQNYPVLAANFAQDSLWDDFLAYHYAGKPYGQGPPDIAERMQAPGYEQIQVSVPDIDPDTVSVENPFVSVQAQVVGERIAYIYSIIMLRYQDRYLIYARDYLQSDTNRTSGGIVYPQWEREDGVIQLDYPEIVAPTVISDGSTSAFAVVEPRAYGSDPKDRIYSVKGYYIYDDTGKQVDARMNFYADRGGEMRDIIGFVGSVETGIRSYPIQPRIGDQFMFIDTWWEQNQNGNWEDVLRAGNVLTFSGQPFVQGIALEGTEPGDYRIGVMVEDLDGNEWASFAPLTIAEGAGSE